MESEFSAEDCLAAGGPEGLPPNCSGKAKRALVLGAAEHHTREYMVRQPMFSWAGRLCGPGIVCCQQSSGWVLQSPWQSPIVLA